MGNDLEELKRIGEEYNKYSGFVYANYFKNGYKNVFIADFDTLKLMPDKKVNRKDQNIHVRAEVLDLFYYGVRYTERSFVTLVMPTRTIWKEFKKHNINIGFGGRYHFILVKKSKMTYRIEKPVSMGVSEEEYVG